ncbi:major pilin protein fimA [Candidatus Rhodobacter oscarellae]|uniref:Major pilin protein fimA n=1 Tax=Candidatus Rhodobacter oscarellae TaxID=1675527 RepID=A0A0J9E7T8_9RHOB|nr:DUF1028 domain-containing protein [Candidatus Rhodobacter lobularis]KMW58797.1 major pilin protein fimA [Candidatus Rhodobacter lobularis]
MTFSITGRCNRTGMFGVAITTSSIAVGARCPWVRAGVGAVATQNVTMPSIGNDVLDQIARGADAETALAAVMATEKHPDFRQVAVVSHKGCAIFSGQSTLGRHAEAVGDDCIAAGNLLAEERLPSVMVDRFQSTPDLHLAERLLGALESGLTEGGGEEGPVHSACLLVADKTPWPLVDLRVDWDDAPVTRLRMLWTEYEPQMMDYVTRALDPSAAPSYGVPGDE